MKRITAILLAVMLVIISATAALGEDNTIWQKGDAGEKVTWIQTRLIELGYMEGEVTGTFDDATEAALMWFQREHNLLVTGMADSKTMEILATAEKRQESLYFDYSAETEEGYYDASYAAMPMGTPMPYAMGNYAKAGTAWEVPEFTTNEYTRIESNRFLSVRTSPLSTFAADVDTSSYAQFRRKVLDRQGISADSIRIE